MTVAALDGPVGFDVSCSHGPPLDRRVAVNGIGFDSVSPEELLSSLDAFLECDRSHVVHFFAAHPTVLARQNPAYREIANRGDLNVADGLPVSLAMRLYGSKSQRITGSDALQLVPAWGLERGVRHYFYGGTPDVLEDLREALVRDHPGIEIVGLDAPPFRAPAAADLEAAAERMRAARADAVWIGLGVPKQDVVANELRSFGAAPVLLCIGAAFDFVAGAKRRAPRWMRSIGMEWAFRLASEPRRLWRRYLIGNAQFLAGVVRDFAHPRSSIFRT